MPCDSIATRTQRRNLGSFVRLPHQWSGVFWTPQAAPLPRLHKQIGSGIGTQALGLCRISLILHVVSGRGLGFSCFKVMLQLTRVLQMCFAKIPFRAKAQQDASGQSFSIRPTIRCAVSGNVNLSTDSMSCWARYETNQTRITGMS